MFKSAITVLAAVGPLVMTPACAMAVTVIAICTSPMRLTAAEAVDVRVGIVAVEDFESELRTWRRTFSKLSRTSGPRMRFHLATGTYGDLLHWMDRKLIDVAILTPGVFAVALDAVTGEESAYGFQYVATVGLPPAASKWASGDRRQAGFHHGYRSICAVSAESGLRGADDLRRLAAPDRLEFVFVHPLSLSGRIAPEHALRANGLQLNRNHISFSYSHTASLRQLTRPSGGRERVAFVWDDALAAAPELSQGVRRLELPELDEIEIPQSVVVIHADFSQFDALKRLLLEYSDEQQRVNFQRLDRWTDRYGSLRAMCRAIGLSAASSELQTVSLGEIGQILLHSARSQPEPPRLALVLAGGGAKCSYQVGAVAALEEKLAELRRANPQCGLDIRLVVGTSGGAINSLPIAMGISSTKDGRNDFQEVWRELDQRDIVRPAFVVRANIGLWFALFQAACAIWIVRRAAPAAKNQGFVLCVVLMALALVEIAVGYIPAAPWRLLGRNHVWHHLWLWCSFGVRACAWPLLALGLGGLVLHWRKRRRGQRLQLPPRRLAWAFLVLLAGLPVVQIITVFFFQQTLSGGEGIEEGLSREFAALIDKNLERAGMRKLQLGREQEGSERLRAISREIIERRMLKRDLVITGNCLEQSAGTLPSDLYFFAQSSSEARPPPLGARGVSLHQYPPILMDVVVGSSAIFPVFPPRTIRHFPTVGEQVELIDGGFAHNSPIEAAVLWGATHIILVEAAPAKRGARRNFAENVAAAFVHLHKQTQLVDVRSKQQVVVFTLTPAPPHMCVIDFADNLIAASIERGYRDATGLLHMGDRVVAGPPRFRKELGEPVFVEAFSDEGRDQPRNSGVSKAPPREGGER